MGTGLAHFCAVGAAVDVDSAPHRIHLAETVETRLTAGKPQDPGQYPVAARIALRQFGAVGFAGRTTLDEHRVCGTTRAHLGANDVPAPRRAIAAVLLAYA